MEEIKSTTKPSTPKKNTKKQESVSPSKEDEIKDEENFWIGDKPFLVKFYSYISLRFITCPSYCLICDKDMDLPTSYKLPVCDSKNCLKVYESAPWYLNFCCVCLRGAV